LWAILNRRLLLLRLRAAMSLVMRRHFFAGQEAVVVGIDRGEVLQCAFLSGEFIATEAAVFVGIELGHALAALTATLAMMFRTFIGGDAAIFVGVQPIEVLGELRIGGGLAAGRACRQRAQGSVRRSRSPWRRRQDRVRV
jgi:hypothetical protein